jgi:hypothetical protein
MTEYGDVSLESCAPIGETYRRSITYPKSRRREVILREILDILLEYEIGYLREGWHETLTALYGELDLAPLPTVEGQG